MLIKYFKTMVFYSGIQAELKAQIKDQNFVNKICQTKHSKNLITQDLFSARNQIPGPNNMKYFISVCEVLSQKLLIKDITSKEQAICAALLSDRISKLNSDEFISDIYVKHIYKWQQSINYFKFNEA